jgi:ankyrin repeat protein
MSEHIALHQAYERGDMEAVKAGLGNPPDFPNCRGPVAAGEIVLEYAIYHSPLAFISTLLELGADPNARTRIDDYATPLEEAETLGHTEIAEALRKITSAS